MGGAAAAAYGGAGPRQMARPQGAAHDREAFEREVQALRAEGTAVAAQVIHDARVRTAYQRQIEATIRELRARVQAGQITWAQAAREAHTLRNETLGVMRGRSSPIGRGVAELLKSEGVTLEALLSRYAQRLFGQGADFNDLSPAQQQRGSRDATLAEQHPRLPGSLERWTQCC